MEILRALGSLAEPPSKAHPRLVEAMEFQGTPDEGAYSDIFLFQLFPYASVYLSPEGMVGGEVRDRIAGFSRALGVEPGDEPDHLSALLAFQAALGEAEGEAANGGDLENCATGRGDANGRDREGWGNARSAFLWEHLLSWLPFYLDRVDSIATGFYLDWARALRVALEAERQLAGPAVRLPLHLREAPGLPDPRQEGGKTLLAALLSPVRCGMILTRSDLARAGGDTGLATRVGERRFVLEALFSQDPETVLLWLAGRARASGARHEEHLERLGEIATFWATRAAATADLLEDLASDARLRT